tara:strand:- start:1447 stop:1683 length:237 start_codon:yes stop_codon:yes gene_type:complete
MILDREELIQELIEIVKKLTRSSEVNSDSSTENLTQWDSLAYMAIISELEITYGVNVTQENIDKFDSIENIADLIVNK